MSRPGLKLSLGWTVKNSTSLLHSTFEAVHDKVHEIVGIASVHDKVHGTERKLYYSVNIVVNYLDQLLRELCRELKRSLTCQVTPCFWTAPALLVFLILSLTAHAEVKPLTELPREQLRMLIKGHMGDWRTETDQRKGVPVPPALRPVPADAKRIALPSPETLGFDQLSLRDAVEQRRSLRAYAETPLTLKELSFLLWCTQGVAKVDRDDKGRIVNQFRTVPSGGARHPFETYLLLNRVEGLMPGVYRFLPHEHALMLIREDKALTSRISAACYGQTAPSQAAAVFVWAAVPYRTEWRYGPIAHRMIAIEAGHVCQNLYLAAESIGAGACAMLAYNQVQMDALIGVDGKDEFTIYMAPVGKKVAGE